MCLLLSQRDPNKEIKKSKMKRAKSKEREQQLTEHFGTIQKQNYSANDIQYSQAITKKIRQSQWFWQAITRKVNRKANRKMILLIFEMND
jgi:hypothetical protein